MTADDGCQRCGYRWASTRASLGWVLETAGTGVPVGDCLVILPSFFFFLKLRNTVAKICFTRIV